MSVTRSNPVHYPRWVLPLAVLCALAVITVGFPFKTLWRQQSALDATSSQIAQINRETAALTQQARATATAAAAIALAREEYQLVQPGQRLIQVLPGNGTGYVAQNSNDPGSQPLVNLSAGTPTASTPHSRVSRVRGFVSRFVQTLEFWH